VRLCRVHFDRIEFDAADFATAVALQVLGPREDATRLRVDLQRSRAEEALSNDYASQLARVTAIAEAARRIGDPELVREVEKARVGALHEADQARPEDWDAVAEDAGAVGDLRGVIGATINATQLRTLDDPTAVRASIDAIEPLVEAHRMLEDRCWLDQSRAEAGLVIGTWDDVLVWGDRVLDVGSAHAFDRVVIRTLHCLVPVAERRRERAILERAAAWLEARRWAMPRSFYGTIIGASIDVSLTRTGVLSVMSPTSAPCAPGSRSPRRAPHG
jgi:hypothetical protein